MEGRRFSSNSRRAVRAGVLGVSSWVGFITADFMDGLSVEAYYQAQAIREGKVNCAWAPKTEDEPIRCDEVPATITDITYVEQLKIDELEQRVDTMLRYSGVLALASTASLVIFARDIALLSNGHTNDS